MDFCANNLLLNELTDDELLSIDAGGWLTKAISIAAAAIGAAVDVAGALGSCHIVKSAICVAIGASPAIMITGAVVALIGVGLAICD